GCIRIDPANQSGLVTAALGGFSGGGVALLGRSSSLAAQVDEMVSRPASGLEGLGLKPAVFLDRDGVIVVPHFRNRRSYAPRRLTDFRLYPEATASLRKLKGAGFLLAVVTNQPDVGNGVTPRSEVDARHGIMTRDLPIDEVQ